MPRLLPARLLPPCLLAAAAALAFIAEPALVTGPAFAADPASRTWSDLTGRYKVKGTFVSLDGDVVTILQENGKELEIPLRKLGPADQAVAKAAAEAAEGSPFKEKDGGSPFMEKGAAGGSAAAPGDAAPLKVGPVAVDWNAAQAVDPQPEHSNWSEAIKPGQLAEGATALKPKTIRLPNLKDIFEKPQALAFSPSGEKAVVGYTHPGVRQGAASTKLVLTDSKTGKILGAGEVEGEFAPLGLSDDGRRVYLRAAKFGFGENGALEVWGLGKSGIERGPSWEPYAEDEYRPNRDIAWGAMTANDRALSIGGRGRLALWDLDAVAPVWYLDLPHGQTPALSPNRKYLAYAADAAVGLLDVATGKVLALLPAEKEVRLDSLAFSPDGRFLAGTDKQTLWVWDVAAGSLYREITLKDIAAFAPIAWADGEHVLVSGPQAATLVHVESRIPQWRYTGATLTEAAGGVTWFYLSAFNVGEALVGAALPHAAAESALQRAMADPNFFLLKPGAAVALDASGIPDGDRAAVSESLRKKLTEAGFTIAGSAPVTVKATSGRGETREIRYHTFGSFNDQTYSVQEYVVGLAFVSNGTTVWESKSSHLPAPFFVQLKKDQTMADLLREHDKPSYEFFKSVRLPKFVPRPSEQAVLGTSEVAMQGIR